MRIEVWSDLACPWCAIGKRRLDRALRSGKAPTEVDVVWRSFELDSTAPRVHAEPQPTLLARKYGVSLDDARAMNARMSEEARKEGLTFDLERCRVGNTFDAHRLIHHAASQGRADALVEGLFRAYLGEGQALGEHEVLVAAAIAAGLDADAARVVLASTDHAEAVRADQARARTLGIQGVPYFVIDGVVGLSGAQPPEVLLQAMA